MTQTDHLLALIAAALAVTTILTVGTLIAADIIRVGGRKPQTAEGGSREPREATSPETGGTSNVR